jgi:GNAT superfamily N-acetyltransferase
VAARAQIVELRDGSRATLRPIRPSDKHNLAEGFAHLSDESRYKRFLTPMNELSKAELKYLTEVDHHDHEAILAQSLDGAPLGVARYVRTNPASASAEAAVAVVDDWQGRGLGTALLQRLADRASEEGIDHFTAIMLASNREMLALCKELGPTDVSDAGNGVLEAEIELPAAAEDPSAPLRNALRNAAAGRLHTRPGEMTRSHHPG